MFFAFAVYLSMPFFAYACTFCVGGYAARQSIRERANTATVIFHGQLGESVVNSNGIGGKTAINKLHYFKSTQQFGQRDTHTIPQYLPVIGDTPRGYLIFGNFYEGKLDITMGLSISEEATKYISECIALPANDPTTRLTFFFKHLDNKNNSISSDAFLEFAKASDQEITNAASRFDVAKLRSWLLDENTETERIGVYSMMLGLIGQENDAAVFEKMLARLDGQDEKKSRNLGGILAGYALIKPTNGWATISKIITNPKMPFDQRWSALGTIRYFQSTDSNKHKSQIISIYAKLIGQPDFIDAAVEDLRRWQWWDCTETILKQYDAKKAMIVKQAILRYAISCKSETSTALIEKIRKTEPDSVRRAEEAIRQFQK